MASAPELKAQIEAERDGRPFLVLRDGEDAQTIVAIDPGRTREHWVGRSESADVRRGWDEEVSTLHAQIEVVRDECTLVDDGLSRNGSYVNEERVHGRHDPLRPHRGHLPPARRGDGVGRRWWPPSPRPRRRSPGPAQSPHRPLPPL